MYKIYQLDLITTLCRSLSGILLEKAILVKLEGFLSPKNYLKAGVPEKNKNGNILQVQNCNKGRTCFISLCCDLLLYYPHIKFLGITFDNRMTFTKHLEEILECFNQKFRRLRIFVNKRWGPSPTTILQITSNV